MYFLHLWNNIMRTILRKSSSDQISVHKDKNQYPLSNKLDTSNYKISSP